MKKFTEYIYITFLILLSSAYLLSILQLPHKIFYFSIIWIIITIMLLLTPNIIRFLTLPVNGFTVFLVAALLSSLALWGAAIIVPQLSVSAKTYSNINIIFATINQVHLDKTAAYILTGIVIGTLFTIYYQLKGNKS